MVNPKTEIRQVCDTSFVWVIPHFMDNIEQKGYDGSPEFQFRQETWYLYFRKRKGEGVICFRLMRVSRDDCIPCTYTYRMCIKDVLGGHYWASGVMTEEFSDYANWGTEVEVCISDLQRDSHRITIDGVLTVQLTFDPPLGGLQGEGVNQAETSSCSTTSVEIETISNLQPNSSARSKLLQNLKDLLLSGKKSDVTFTVKGVEFKAHQCILCCRSPVFDKMFDHDMVEQSSGSVQITDCVPEVFEVFLQYLYTASLDLNLSNVVELYYLADKYGIKEMAADCVHFMLGNLTVESFCDYVSVALRHCEQELLESANLFLADNVKQIMTSDKWKIFIVENPAEGNELLIKALSKVKLLRE